MIRVIYSYYLKFPPVARKAINYSLTGLAGYAGIDYEIDTENILLGCEQLNKKIFV